MPSCTTSRSLLAVTVALAAGAGFIIGSSSPEAEAQDRQRDRARQNDAQDTPAMPAGMQEAMARWEQHSSLTEHHRELNRAEGTWLIEATWRMAPDAPAEASTMMAKIRPIMGGRFMYEEQSAVMEMAPGQKTPWSGVSITGYDNSKDKYFFIWFDSMSTSIATGWGEKTDAGEVAFETEMYDPMRGVDVQYRITTKQINKDRASFVMRAKDPGTGAWYTQMEMAYTRAE